MAPTDPVPEVRDNQFVASHDGMELNERGSCGIDWLIVWRIARWKKRGRDFCNCWTRNGIRISALCFLPLDTFFSFFFFVSYRKDEFLTVFFCWIVLIDCIDWLIDCVVYISIYIGRRHWRHPWIGTTRCRGRCCCCRRRPTRSEAKPLGKEISQGNAKARYASRPWCIESDC